MGTLFGIVFFATMLVGNADQCATSQCTSPAPIFFEVGSRGQ